MISRSSFILVIIWNISKATKPGSRSTSTSVSKVHFFSAIGFSLSSHFHSSIALFFFLLFLFVLQDTALFSGLCCSCWMEHWPFFSLSLIIKICFRFLVFLDLDEISITIVAFVLDFQEKLTTKFFDNFRAIVVLFPKIWAKIIVLKKGFCQNFPNYLSSCQKSEKK